MTQHNSSEHEAMISKAIAALLVGSILEAGKIVAAFEAKQPNARGMGIDWSRGMPEHGIRRAEYLLNIPYDDLPFTAEIRRAIGAELALSQLLGGRADTGRILQRTDGKFFCKSLENFINNKPCGRIGDYVADLEDDDEEHREQSMAILLSPGSLAFEYANTKMAEAANECFLKEVLDHPEYYEDSGGFEILPSGTRCAVCQSGKLKYKWDEFETMPRLPRHWGCTCSYVTWP